MTVGTIRPIALSRLSHEVLSVMISRRCHSALYGCLVHDFLPEVSHGSLARVQVPARHSRCGASKALRARGSPPSHSILLDLNSSQMVQGICISGTAYDQVENKLSVGYEWLGEHVVKNIAKPVRVYRVLTDPASLVASGGTT